VTTRRENTTLNIKYREAQKSMSHRNSKDEASMRLMAVVAGSSFLMAVWFFVHPFSALICTFVAVIILMVSAWLTPLGVRPRGKLPQKLGKS
jgi:uncharacterized membrane protein (GlpM family)